MGCLKCNSPFLEVKGTDLYCPRCGHIQRAEMNVEITDSVLKENYERIIALLQQGNKAINEAVKLMKFLVGEKSK